MYKFDVTRSFDKDTGRVSSKITVIQTDPGLPHKIIQVGDSLNDSTTLWGETWAELELTESDFLRELNLKIDRIRDNKEHISHGRIVEY